MSFFYFFLGGGEGVWLIALDERYVYYRGDRVGQLGHSEVLLLQHLYSHMAEVIAKDELLHCAWPNKVVEQNSLTVAIKNIRKILSSRATTIEVKTHHGRGYSLHGDRQELDFISTFTCNDGDEFEIKSSIVQYNMKPNTKLQVFRFMKLALLCFSIFTSILFFKLNNKVDCYEAIGGVSICSTRPLTPEERHTIKESLDLHGKHYRKYIYGCNFSTKNLFLHPIE
ncbi:winged helix-turn-helix domain-containing protein [Aeromonas bestiarum]|uniref:winged helix-turn-helix domain-containing protein n=1 Tax=Aeromonas bestiarum TaxID=105751 RepID=UPI003D1DFB1D